MEEKTKSKDKCIFVSGLPYTTTEEELREVFVEKCGEIEHINMPKYQDTGRNIGYAHIYFKKNQSLNKALELDHTNIGTRYITVQPAKGEKETSYARKADTEEIPSTCKTAFVKSLSYDITEEEVGNKFRPCGKIKAIRFVHNSKYGHFKGFCYVDFYDHKALLKALELNGKDLKGRKMIVDFEENFARKGYKYRTPNPSKYNEEYQRLNNTLQKKRNRANANVGEKIENIHEEEDITTV